MKRLMTLFVAVTFAGQAWAEDFTSGNLKYTITDAEKHEVSVGKISDDNKPQGDLVIPAEVENGGVTYTVITIRECAFWDCSGLTSVTISDSVKSIGNIAFSGCNGLTSVTMGNSVTSIGECAFELCSSLTTVTIPNSVTSIGNSAFSYCSGLTSVTIPDSVKSIGSYAFSDCSGLTSVTIPNSVDSIGGYAFAGCSGLTSVTIPDSVKSIGKCAFWGCSSLTEIDVDSANTNYTSENGVLFNKDKTTIVCYPEGKTETTYTIPNSVTSIGDFAFNFCDSLTSITIPNSVTSIGLLAFLDCTSLTEIDVDSANTNYTSENGVLFNKNKTTIVCYPEGKTGTTYTIPSSVTSIGDGAFLGCSGLTSVTIPDSVKSIGEEAFRWCSGLTSVIIPNSVESIGGFAFEVCSGLTSVTIPNSVDSIGGYAFGGCSGLTSITIPNSVDIIGTGAFSGCTATIYCEFEREPAGWDSYWNFSGCPVVWVYKTTENQGGNEQGGENLGGNENNPSTAVEENTANAVNIYAYGKNIVVENAAEEIRVYDAMGRLVCRDVACDVNPKSWTKNFMGCHITTRQKLR